MIMQANSIKGRGKIQSAIHSLLSIHSPLWAKSDVFAALDHIYRSQEFQPWIQRTVLTL
jgi:hypothetical protein